MKQYIIIFLVLGILLIGCSPIEKHDISSQEDICIKIQEKSDDYYKDKIDGYIERAKKFFGIENSEITCASIDQNGRLFIHGTDEDTPFDASLRFGPCMGAGHDCGWDACFRSTSQEILKIKEILCLKLEEYTFEDMKSNNTEKTEWMQDRCRQGVFDGYNKERKMPYISIHQDTGFSKYISFVTKGPDCFDNK